MTEFHLPSILVAGAFALTCIVLALVWPGKDTTPSQDDAPPKRRIGGGLLAERFPDEFIAGRKAGRLIVNDAALLSNPAMVIHAYERWQRTYPDGPPEQRAYILGAMGVCRHAYEEAKGFTPSAPRGEPQRSL